MNCFRSGPSLTPERMAIRRRRVEIRHAEAAVCRGVGLLDEPDGSVGQHFNRLAERARCTVVDAGQEVIVAVAEQLRAAQRERVHAKVGVQNRVRHPVGFVDEVRLPAAVLGDAGVLGPSAPSLNGWVGFQ